MKENKLMEPQKTNCIFNKGIFNKDIKYCIWYYTKALEFKQNKVKYNNIYSYYKAISYLPFVNPEYIIDIYDKIRCETKNND
ncbi:hypothetical protein H8356DRAFT_1347138 [Neocallimastix lanati (nom. inval.)]|nr:hypothetical protein H8356DRAFT_1347138 [Neocallimastix sp. JGI-2020a]